MQIVEEYTLSLSDSIVKAIAAHGLWKTRLKEAIETGTSMFRVDMTKVDNMCDFGKWLYSLPPNERTSERWEKVRQLHAAFHVEAARVLDLALKGKKSEAEAALEPGNPYSATSAALVTELQAWKSQAT
jgi:methyl-accepting chemotaxis protein